MSIKQKCPAPASKLGNSKKSQKYCNKLSSQRSIILKLFEAHNPLNTFQLRDLGICHPGGRISELRDLGFRILTHKISLNDSNGMIHKGIASYLYCGKKEAQ